MLHNHFRREFYVSTLFMLNLSVTLISRQKLVKEFNLCSLIGSHSFFIVNYYVNPILEFVTYNRVYKLHKVWT